MRTALLSLPLALVALLSAACFDFGPRKPPPPKGGSIAGTIQVQSVTGQVAHHAAAVRAARDAVAAALAGPSAAAAPPSMPTPTGFAHRPARPRAKSSLPLQWRAGDVLVSFDHGAYDSDRLGPVMARMARDAGLDVTTKVVRCTDARYCMVELFDRKGRLLDEDATGAAQKALHKHRGPRVHLVAKDLKKWGFFVPNDPLFSFQWHYDFIHMQAAWDIEQGDENLVVAIVDSGAVVAHPDLTNRWARDNQGRVIGVNMVDPRGTDPTDPGDNLFGNGNSSWHGTHIAGTIGAETNNGQGVAGITIRGRLLPVRVLGDQLSGFDGDIMDGIFWAIGRHVQGSPDNVAPARVVNLSLGGPTDDVSQQFWDESIASVLSDPGKPVLVAAAGNSDEDASGIVPANVAGMITVGAVSIQGTRASYSNFGDTVDIVAPGGDEGTDLNADGQPDGVLSTVNPDFDWRDGTSMAAPHVTGVAALVLAVNPQLDQAGVEAVLKQSADATGQCNEGCGAGWLDAVQALLTAGGQVQDAPTLTTDVTQVFFPLGFQSQIASVLNLGNAPFSFAVTVDGPQADLFSVTPTSGTAGAAGDASATVPLTITVDRSSFQAGSANLKIATTDQTPEQDVTVSLNFNDDPNRSPSQIQSVQVGAFQKAQSGGLVSVAQAIATRDNGFAYEIKGLRAGDYLVYAVGDDNDDGQFNAQTESFGAYPTEDSPAVVHVDGKGKVDKVDFGINAAFVTGVVGGVGAPCADDNACNFQPDAACITTFSGGYCSRLCGDDGQCGDNGACEELQCDTGPCDVCLARCVSDAQCRFDEGYHCSLGECVPANF